MKLQAIGGGAAVLLLAATLQAQGLRRVAVLPLLAPRSATLAEGEALSAKVAGRMEGRAQVSLSDWGEVKALMIEHGLDPRELSRPAVLRRIGEILEVDHVVAGHFEVSGDRQLVSLKSVRVADGSVATAKPWSLPMDIIVDAPAFTVDSPVLPGQAEEMRDALARETCDGAADRVDAYEKRILELKARYWALQLHRGVAMSALKFNPGSTITDPELKREFYGHMKAWMKQEVVPELTPTESREFAEIDDKAFRLARLCAIL